MELISFAISEDSLTFFIVLVGSILLRPEIFRLIRLGSASAEKIKGNEFDFFDSFLNAVM